MYLETGAVKLSVTSRTGREAVVGTIAPREFFGEGCLSGQALRAGTATAMTPSVILFVRKAAMVRLLTHHHALCDRFLAQVLARNIRIEEDLIEQFFDSNEKRLARALLVLAQYGTTRAPLRHLPKMSPEMLARMIGTTRSRVRFFLNKFKKLGFIEDNGMLTVNRSLLTVVLHD
jgi:CRP-like cAMP-binding protein